MLEIDSEQHELVIPEHVLLEFGSLLRKFVAPGSINGDEARGLLESLLGVRLHLAGSDLPTIRRGFELSGRLGQSDTFDSTGYAIAERLGAEFWVSDRRFANAASTARLPNIRYVD